MGNYRTIYLCIKCSRDILTIQKIDKRTMNHDPRDCRYQLEFTSAKTKALMLDVVTQTAIPVL